MTTGTEAMRTAVMDWIEEHFEVREIDCRPFDGLPGGVIVTDTKGEELCVYFDILTGEVAWT